MISYYARKANHENINKINTTIYADKLKQDTR